MASSSATLVALLVVSCAAMASAAPFNVGDGQGWTTGVDYTGWTRGKTFAVGDKLVFNYASKLHTVTEVSKSGYDACSGSSPLSNDDSGSTTIPLTTPGTHYFICAVPSHCAAGMKVAVTVAGGPGSAATPTGAAGGALMPAMCSVVAAATGALIKVALLRI